MGMPVCRLVGGAEITHVFTYVDGCVTLNKFTSSSVQGVLPFGYMLAGVPVCFYTML